MGINGEQKVKYIFKKPVVKAKPNKVWSEHCDGVSREVHLTCPQDYTGLK